jgi:hypothetical protein
VSGWWLLLIVPVSFSAGFVLGLKVTVDRDDFDPYDRPS